MTRHIFLLAIVLCGMSLVAQETSRTITVKNSETNTGVLIIKAQDSKGPLQLQCNQGMPDCTALKGGTYEMVQLPKNHGLYDCANVEIYAQAKEISVPGKLIGEYCLNEK